jgi:hypothetical protein
LAPEQARGSVYVCPHTTICVSIGVAGWRGAWRLRRRVALCMCVFILLCVLVLLYVCPHTIMRPLILVHTCPHATAYVSACYCICVHILLHMVRGRGLQGACAGVPRERSICARMSVGVTGRMLLHTAIYVSSYCYMCVLIYSSPGLDGRWRHRPRRTVGVSGPTLIRAAIYVSSYCYMCVLIYSSPGLDGRWRHRPRRTVGVSGPTLIRAAIYVSSYILVQAWMTAGVTVRILLYTTICVLMLLCVLSLLCTCICVLMLLLQLLYMCPHTAISVCEYYRCLSSTQAAMTAGVTVRPSSASRSKCLYKTSTRSATETCHAQRRAKMPLGVGCAPPISRGCRTLRGPGSHGITEQRAPLAVQVPLPSLLALL